MSMQTSVKIHSNEVHTFSTIVDNMYNCNYLIYIYIDKYKVLVTCTNFSFRIIPFNL